MNKTKTYIFIIGFFFSLISCNQENKHSEFNNDAIAVENSYKNTVLINKKTEVDSNTINNADTITRSSYDVNDYGQRLPKQIKKIIPPDYFVLNFAIGDINLDSLEDIVLVLAKNNEDSLSTRETPILRPLLLLIAQTKGDFFIARNNDSVVYYNGFDINLKDPFTDIRIKNGGFSISHYGGFRPRWTRLTTFKFSPFEDDWFLSEDNFSCFDTLMEIECQDKIYTAKEFGRIPFSKFNIYEDNEATRKYVRIYPR